MSTPSTDRPTVESQSAEPTPQAPADHSDRLVPAMDPAVKSIQPGGGIVMSLELGWGKLRRQYLRRFRKGYVERMIACRNGQRASIPVDPIDSRDVKFFRNQDTFWWADEDDPYLWRDSLPFVRVGLAELFVLAGGALLLAGVVLIMGSPWWWLSVPLLVFAALVAWFFRNPARSVPADPGTVVSPADGKLVQIDQIDDPDLGRCVQFGIFLSIFNVHVNRASLPGKVIAIRYRPGKMLNALRPESAKENENLDLIIESGELESRQFRIRQITGQFARRIVCWVRPGDILQRGETYGMIKLGSRTELIIPESDSFEIVAKIGEKVCAGSTVFGRYRPSASGDDSKSIS